MKFMLNAVRAILRRPSSPHPFRQSGFLNLEPSSKIEEETLPHYARANYLLLHIGDVLQDRYQVINKLGYGANSTVWFCRDLKQHEYVALKVCTSSSKPQTEHHVLQHIKAMKSVHSGASLIRTFKDGFILEGPQGRKHQCLIMEPMLASIADVLPCVPHHRLPESLLRMVLREVLPALDFLHSEAGVVHTDLQPGNLMFNSREPSVAFAMWESLENQHPSPRKVSEDGAVIYKSRSFDLNRDMKSMESCMITDLGNAWIGSELRGRIQPEMYRAPEVLLGMSWGPPTDIWNLGVMVWDLFRGDGVHLFHLTGADKTLAKAKVLSEMISVLGAPSVEFLQRSDTSWTYWTKAAEWRGLVPLATDYHFRKLEIWLEGEEQRKFIAFIRKMLVWEPELRQTATQLLEDDWLNER